MLVRPTITWRREDGGKLRLCPELLGRGEARRLGADRQILGEDNCQDGQFRDTSLANVWDNLWTSRGGSQVNLALGLD